MMCESNGINYFVETTGKGSPVVLLHGFTGSTSTWDLISAYLIETSQLIKVDVIGHGKTDSPEDINRYNILEVAADLKHLLDRTGIEKADFLGYSMGGRLAITFAVNYPEKVRKLVLESTTPGLRTEQERIARRQQDASLADKILFEGLETFVDYWEKIPLFKTQMNLSAATRETIKKQRLLNNPAGLANSLLGMGTGSQPSWWESMKSLHSETLILTGELDKKFCQIGEEMVKIIPRAEFIQIKQAGHAIHVEEPEIFGTIVSRFLSEKGETIDMK